MVDSNVCSIYEFSFEMMFLRNTSFDSVAGDKGFAPEVRVFERSLILSPLLFVCSVLTCYYFDNCPLLGQQTLL